jgi:uncharacterized membrane protein YgcG
MRLVLRRLATLLAAIAVALGFATATALPAHAADDQIDSFSIDYIVQPSGVLNVTEKITWRFGSNSGRHGIKRDLITREPYGTSDQDAVYQISNIEVSASAGVSATKDVSTIKEQDGRLLTTEIKIGDANSTISADTATYTISYDVTGAMRTFPDENPPYDEFYWDATGSGNPLIKKLAVTASVPGGAQEVSCFAGEVKANTPCTAAKVDTSDDEAVFSQTNLPARENVTIGVKIKPGLVADNKPHLEADGSKLSSGEKAGLVALGGSGLLSAIVAPILGVFYYRRRGRDQRYAGLAPGTAPLAGQPAEVIMNDPKIPVPVAFSPPRIPVGEAGLLVDGQFDPRDTAATIIDLAVRGALTVRSESKDDFEVTLVDPSRAAAPHEMTLLNTLFGGAPPGAVKDLSSPGSMLTAHQALTTQVTAQVEEHGWFTRIPKSKVGRGFGAGLPFLVIFSGFLFTKVVWLLLVPLLPIVITAAVVRAKMRRGQRTAEGRAICDQVEGFKLYLSTAEAEQLKFEEGEDIFSRYLPWAIAFDLADRWAKICGDLVAMGRLPDTTPYWYYGSYSNFGAFNTGFLTGSLLSAATPVPSTGSSGSGFGGGSSFGGGGFSGGGGGGGGSSSW